MQRGGGVGGERDHGEVALTVEIPRWCIRGVPNVLSVALVESTGRFPDIARPLAFLE